MTTDQRKQIAEEEYYRHEIRKSLEEQKPRESRGWKFLNSGFGLFVLSSVVLTLISNLYTIVQDSVKARRERIEKVRRLDNEVSNRIAQSLRYLDIEQAKVRGGVYATNTYPRVTDAFIYAGNYLDNDFPALNAGQGKQYNFSLYPEMKELTFRALITELTDAAPDDEKKSFGTALLGYERLLDKGTYYDDRSPTDSAAYLQGVMQVRDMVEKEIELERWGILVPSS